MDQQVRELIAFWKVHGPDSSGGGFHGTLNREGASVPPTDKGVIQQTRHLFTFSVWYARREQSPEIKAIADDLYRFVVTRLRDPNDGEFFWKVTRSGEVVDRRKILYAQSFAIYALAHYAEAFGSAEARAHALTCFESIDRRAHDQAELGYDQTLDPAWFSPGTQKETNTHIHLLEAFTELYRVTHDTRVRARLSELVEVVARRIVQPEGYARKEFRRDFTPIGEAVVSYGHDIETSWLLLDALDALGRKDDRAFSDIALRLGEYSARAGFDSAQGGYFEEGVPGGAPAKREKIWWIQAEALSGLFHLYARTRDQTQLTRLEKTLDFIERHQRDREYGEWYWGVLDDGSVGPRGSNKGEEWKASYHDVRALLFTSDWIARFLAAPR
ncbi:MAG TPA: AGE family epimerase/isomerase [Polyangiaceae bacterium]|nr:AGE family epimerase/isomerase [Polyangiaceae bacterium]